MISASIVGATGYTGVELVRLLSSHPNVKLVHLTTRNYIGKKIKEVFPSLTGYGDKVFTGLDIKTVIADSDIIFIALPHGNAVPVVMEAVAAGKKVIDLGADFRFRSASTYEWYGIKHDEHGLTKEAVYGLPEIYRDKIKVARVIANPVVILQAPFRIGSLLKASLVKPDSIVVDAKSGVSESENPSVGSLFSECNENVKAYNMYHRHTPEMRREISICSAKTRLFLYTTPDTYD